MRYGTAGMITKAPASSAALGVNSYCRRLRGGGGVGDSIPSITNEHDFHITQCLTSKSVTSHIVRGGSLFNYMPVDLP